MAKICVNESDFRLTFILDVALICVCLSMYVLHSWEMRVFYTQIHNGVMQPSVRYTKTGYTVQQSDVRFSPLFVSTVACPLVVTPSSGHVTLSSAGGKATVATYTCATGYTLIGVNASTCIANTKTSTYWNYPSGGTCSKI